MQISPRMHAEHERQNFHFQEITDTLKMNIFFKLPETFLVHKRTKVKNRIQNYNLFSIFFLKWRKRFLTSKIVLKIFKFSLGFQLLNKIINF